MILLYLFSGLIGLLLGMLGGGGSILAVPLLTYVAGMSPKAAIASSLLVVGITSGFALILHAIKSNVAWKTGFIFSVAAMFGGFLGGYLASFFDGKQLLILFALLMGITGIAMFRKKAPLQAKPEKSFSPIIIAFEGLFVGALTGLVGAGGGFLVVPVLVLMGQMNMKKAIGTSLLVITLKSFAAFSGHALHVDVDYPLTFMVALLAVLGSAAGVLLAKRLTVDSLKKIFAVFVLFMAVYMLWREAGMIAGSILAIVQIFAIFYLSKVSKLSEDKLEEGVVSVSARR